MGQSCICYEWVLILRCLVYHQNVENDLCKYLLYSFVENGWSVDIFRCDQWKNAWNASMVKFVPVKKRGSLEIGTSFSKYRQTRKFTHMYIVPKTTWSTQFCGREGMGIDRPLQVPPNAAAKYCYVIMLISIHMYMCKFFISL